MFVSLVLIHSFIHSEVPPVSAKSTGVLYLTLILELMPRQG